MRFCLVPHKFHLIPRIFLSVAMAEQKKDERIVYDNPLVTRYSSKEMSYLWSPQVGYVYLLYPKKTRRSYTTAHLHNYTPG